jgi:hypothetical protein
MRKNQLPTSTVIASVTEMLPSFGLAYLVGDDERSWAVTKSTQGCGLQSLTPGSRVALTLTHHREFSVASAYAPLD